MNREEILQTIKDLIANGNIEEANALLNEQATFLADYYDQAAGLFENLDTVQMPFLCRELYLQLPIIWKT